MKPAPRSRNEAVMRIAIVLCSLTTLAHAEPVSVTARAPAPAREPDQSWFTLGAITDGTAWGVRLQSDWLAGSNLSAGLFMSVLQRGEQVMGVRVPQASGGLFVAGSTGLVGPLWLRGQLGVGGAISAHASESSVLAGEDVTTASLIGEAGLLLSVHLGDRFALFGGPVLQRAASPAPGYSADTVTIFFGLQHR